MTRPRVNSRRLPTHIFRRTDQPRFGRFLRYLYPIVSLGLLSLALLPAGCTDGAAPTAAAPQPPVAASYPPDPELGPFVVHALSTPREIEVTGDLNNGVTQAVRALLDATPGIQVVHLNSPGGIAHEGYLLGQLIKERHLATYTATICASACTEAFLGGSPRYIAKGAKLGFHSASRSLGGTAFGVVNDALRHFYKEAGLPDDFIDRALRTPPDDIWFPTNDELRAAHVITDVVDRSKFAASGGSYQLGEKEIDSALKTNTLFSAISVHDSAGYGEIRDLFVKGTKAGRDVTDIKNEADKLVLDKFLPRYAVKAPDASVLNYFAVEMKQLQYLNDKNPDACVADAFPELGVDAPSLASILPGSMQTDELAALAQIVNAAFSDPHEPPSADETTQAMSLYARKLQASDSDALEIIRTAQKHRAEPSKLCSAMISALQAIAALPTREAAIVQRHLLMTHS